VFANPFGEPLDPGPAADPFFRVLAKAGPPRIRVHDLRHTVTTLLLARGVHPKVVAERVGFEPTGLSANGFQDRLHKPLGHLSKSTIV